MTAVLVPILVSSVLLLLGTLYTVWASRKGHREDYVLATLDRVQTRVFDLERRERIRDDYIILLRGHIEEGKPPPPPPYPNGLTNASS